MMLAPPDWLSIIAKDYGGMVALLPIKDLRPAVLKAARTAGNSQERNNAFAESRKALHLGRLNSTARASAAVWKRGIGPAC
jgi:hypothetical protein